MSVPHCQQEQQHVCELRVAQLCVARCGCPSCVVVMQHSGCPAAECMWLWALGGRGWVGCSTTTTFHLIHRGISAVDGHIRLAP